MIVVHVELNVTYMSNLLSSPSEADKRAFLDISADVSADNVFPEPGVPWLIVD